MTMATVAAELYPEVLRDTEEAAWHMRAAHDNQAGAVCEHTYVFRGHVSTRTCLMVVRARIHAVC